MRLSLLCLELGAATYLSDAVRSNIRGCFVTMRGVPRCLHPLLSPAEAGLAVAAAILGSDATTAVGAVQRALLTAIEIEHPTDGFSLPADALSAHPLFAPWIGASLADAVAKSLMAGAIYTSVAPGAPTIGDLEIAAHGDAITARQQLRFPVNGSILSVSAHYGEALEDAPMAALTRVGGPALINVGELARALTMQTLNEEAAPRAAIESQPAYGMFRNPSDTLH